MNKKITTQELIAALSDKLLTQEKVRKIYSKGFATAKNSNEWNNDKFHIIAQSEGINILLTDSSIHLFVSSERDRIVIQLARRGAERVIFSLTVPI